MGDIPEKFEQWAIVELFGHQRIAGLVTEQILGGASFVRVDVPATNGRQGFTKFYGPSAIYAMTVVDEETGRAAAECLSPRPIEEFSARQMLGISHIDANDEIPL